MISATVMTLTIVAAAKLISLSIAVPRRRSAALPSDSSAAGPAQPSMPRR
jgi:hypothetical protein